MTFSQGCGLEAEIALVIQAPAIHVEAPLMGLYMSPFYYSL
jgi:hypothetical protein